MIGYSEGLNLDNLDETTEEEINANLMSTFRVRRPLYELSANSLMLDYAPDFAKLHRWGSDLFGRPDMANITTLAMQNMLSYMMTGWETGILNTFHTLTRAGMSKAQLMEIIMFSQLYAGMRGLGHVYHAVGDLLPIMWDPPGNAAFPEGWDVDPDAFKSGLDLSTRELTEQDHKNLTAWYEKNIGFVPNSILFGIKHHPQFVKVNRAKWEVAIKTLPKQSAPYLMLRHRTTIGSREGLREAVLLGKAWGITSERLARGITASANYFTGFEGMYAAYDAVDDLL
jgi:hypothetical protein